MKDIQLNDKVALVTGGGSGIGAAAARLFAQKGAKVGVLSRTEEEVHQVAEEIRNTGGEAFELTADISVVDEIKPAIDQLVQTYGQLDIVFANAGINGVWAPIEELEPEEWDQTIRVNLRGTFLTIKYAVPYLKKQGGSIIINSSINGTRVFSNTGATAYSTTKAGQVALTKMLALELAKYRIRVNVICPGAIDTQIEDNTVQRHLKQAREPVSFPEGSIPLTGGSPGSSQQVAQLVLFLASDASDLITGTEIWIDGGESLMEG